MELLVGITWEGGTTLYSLYFTSQMRVWLKDLTFSNLELLLTFDMFMPEQFNRKIVICAKQSIFLKHTFFI